MSVEIPDPEIILGVILAFILGVGGLYAYYKIRPMIKNEDSVSEQNRDHVEMYREKITDEQSKYVALHVGIFWCIGTFRIKDGDSINIMLDSKTIFEHLREEKSTNDEFIKKRTRFINQLINQRQLEIKYILESTEKNLAKIK